MGPAYVRLLENPMGGSLSKRPSEILFIWICSVYNRVWIWTSKAVGSCGKECLGKSNDLINGKWGCPIKINSNLMDGFDFIGTRDRLNSFAEEWAVTAELSVMGSMCFRCSVSLGDHSMPHFFFKCFPTADSEVNCLSSSHQRRVVLLPSQHAKDHVCSIIHLRCINVTFLSALLL